MREPTNPRRAAISRRIRSLMALRGMTATDLAEAIGVRPKALSERLTGDRHWGVSVCLIDVAEALRVRESTLTYGRPWPDTRSPLAVEPARCSDDA